MRGRRVSAVVLLGACAGLVASGCGSARQDKGEAQASFTLEVLGASFPAKQAIARPASFQVQVHNAGTRTAPNVAVTLDSFSFVSHYSELAANKRPVWVIEQGPGLIPRQAAQSQAISPPGSGQTAYVSTWSLGPLAAGRTQSYRWRVVPVKAGHFTVRYTVAAGLAGRAKARLASGRPVSGALTSDIAPLPPRMHVDPASGRVVPGAYPSKP